MADQNPEFEGTWVNTRDPYHGYLKIHPYKNQDEGGEALALVHAKHGKSEPPIWYRGVWKPTDMGWEVICGPYHWKNIAMFSTPDTREMGVRNYFRSELNGWGQCNMGKLGPGEEQEFIDSLKQQLPAWQTEPSYWSDYPSATWQESKKHMQPTHSHDGGGAPEIPIPGVPLEDQVTHNGGQPVAPQVAMPNMPPFAIPSSDPATGQAPLPPAGGGGGGGQGGGENPPPPPDNGGGDSGGGQGGGEPKPPPPDNGGGGGEKPAPAPQDAEGKAPAPGGNGGDSGAKAAPESGDKSNGKNGDAGKDQQPAKDKKSDQPKDSKDDSQSKDGGKDKPADDSSGDDKDSKGAIASAVDSATDVVDDITGGFTQPAGDTVDDFVENTTEAVGEAASKLFGRKSK